jgi:hypothetical protein
MGGSGLHYGCVVRDVARLRRLWSYSLDNRMPRGVGPVTILELPGVIPGDLNGAYASNTGKQLGHIDRCAKVHKRLAMNHAFNADVKNLLVLQIPYASDPRQYAGGQWQNDVRSRCPKCGLWLDSTMPSHIIIRVDYLGRQGFTEYLWNSHSLPIFREDLVAHMQRNRFTGFVTYPVVLDLQKIPDSHRKRKEAPTYFLLAPKSYVELEVPEPYSPRCTECQLVQYKFPKIGSHLNHGIRVRSGSWDGADMCKVPSYGIEFMSVRAAVSMLDSGYAKHFCFVRPGDYCRWEEFDVRRWTSNSYKKHIESFLIRKSHAVIARGGEQTTTDRGGGREWSGESE